MIELNAYKAANDRKFQDFIDYLENTLIPDLRESGSDATADDFETCIGYMSGEPIYEVQYPAGTEGRLIGEDIERLVNEYDGQDLDIGLEVRCDPDDQRSSDER